MIINYYHVYQNANNPIEGVLRVKTIKKKVSVEIIAGGISFSSLGFFQDQSERRKRETYSFEEVSEARAMKLKDAYRGARR